MSTISWCFFLFFSPSLGSANVSLLGVILGVYNTKSGGNGSSKAWFSGWKYTPIAQEVDIGVFDYVQ
jgi:hypothetical protein